jgi:dihydrofolate reductase
VRGMIVAMGENRVIGLGGKLPWHYPEDLKRFKRLTTGGTIIMGRLTHESIGRVLPGRRNLVVTRRAIPGVECFPTLEAAIAAAEQAPGDVWFIGGARIFAEAMRFADLIDVTYVPDLINDAAAVYFPVIDEDVWEAGPRLPHENDARLERRVYRRRKSVR